jgi:predicted ATP-dependent protease
MLSRLRETTMIAEKTAVLKKSLAATLSLALGLSLPGGAWAAVVSAPAIRGTVPVAAPALSLSAMGTAPILPAVLPSAVDAHPVIELINSLQKAGFSLPQTLSSRADAAKIRAAAQALPDGSATRQQLSQIAESITASNSGGEAFDGSTAKAETPSAESGGLLNRVAGHLPTSMARLIRPEAPAPQPEDPKKYELTAAQVRYAPDAGTLPSSTRDLPFKAEKVIGQDDALKAIRFALEMKPKGYNLFVAGADGSGRAMALRRLLGEIAPAMATPNDRIAVTNFENKDEPILVELPPGKGVLFAKEADAVLESLKEAIPMELTMGAAGQAKQKAMQMVQGAQVKMRKEFDAEVAKIVLAGKFGVDVHTEQKDENRIGISMSLSFEGKPLTEDQLSVHLTAGDFTKDEVEQAKTELKAKSGEIQAMFAEVAQKLGLIQRQVQAQFARLDRETAGQIIAQHMAELTERITAGPPTAEEEAWKKKAEAAQEKLSAAIKALENEPIGRFKVLVQQDETKAGIALLLGDKPLNPAIAEKLVEAGMLEEGEYAAATAQLQAKIDVVQAEAAQVRDAHQAEWDAIQEKKPKNTAETADIRAYIEKMTQFASDNYKIFMGLKMAEGMQPVPGSRAPDPDDFFRVSVLQDNSKQTGAPVIWEENPTYERLFGVAEGNQRNMIIPGAGIVKTEGIGGPSFKPGSFMKANGGFLVLDAMSVLKNPGAWQALMLAVRNGQAEIADGGFRGMALREDTYHFPTKVKVILTGSPMIQMLLAQHDDDFAANFQAIAQFQPNIKINAESEAGFLNYLKIAGLGIMDLAQDAIGRVMSYAARLADSNKYFTAQFGVVHGLLHEAAYAAKQAGRKEITAEDVDAALQAKIDREDVHYKRMMELYKNKIFRIETTGEAVGQGNGLAVMGSHGVQMRVTVVTGPGAPGIVSVDKDSGSTGRSFNKALGNVSSFLMHEFGQEKALKAHIRISYEQNYGGIDGDSATSTEDYVILSALSGIPIQQRFAYTGSADQFGNVQAIGGVNEKIEGFFYLCKHNGLTGDQGVIIPKSNVADLQLNPEVAQAIAEGKFHIYAVDHVSQGAEIIMGTAYKTIKEKAARRLVAIAKEK